MSSESLLKTDDIQARIAELLAERQKSIRPYAGVKVTYAIVPTGNNRLAGCKWEFFDTRQEIRKSLDYPGKIFLGEAWFDLPQAQDELFAVMRGGNIEGRETGWKLPGECYANAQFNPDEHWEQHSGWPEWTCSVYRPNSTNQWGVLVTGEPITFPRLKSFRNGVDAVWKWIWPHIRPNGSSSAPHTGEIFLVLPDTRARILERPRFDARKRKLSVRVERSAGGMYLTLSGTRASGIEVHEQVPDPGELTVWSIPADCDAVDVFLADDKGVTLRHYWLRLNDETGSVDPEEVEAGIVVPPLNPPKGEKFARFAIHAFDIYHSSAIKGRFVDERTDDGIDVEWKDFNGRVSALGVVKYRLSEQAELESVVSAFKAKAWPNKTRNLGLFDQDFDEAELLGIPDLRIFTASTVGSLVSDYFNSDLPSAPFLNRLAGLRKVVVVDLQGLQEYFEAIYKSAFGIPKSLRLRLDRPPIIYDDKIYLGVASVVTIRDLYQQHGEGLFYENVREFIGFGKGNESVNAEILETLKRCPGAFLERNNGLTFKAESVEFEGSTNTLLLRNGALINGCQTTRCIVQAPNDISGAHVAVKVVSRIDATDAWEVSKTANNQNAITRINLEIAEFMRPQLVRSMLAQSQELAVRATTNAPAAQILEDMSEEILAYEEIRSIFIGLFMNNPRQIFNTPANRIGRGLELLRLHYRSHERLRELIQLLASVVKESSSAVGTFIRAGASDAQDVVGFKRLFEEDNAYRPFIAIVGIFFALDIASEADFDARKQELPQFLADVSRLVGSEPARYRRCVKDAMVEIITYAKAAFAKDRKSMSSNLRGLLQNTEVETYCEGYALHQRLARSEQPNEEGHLKPSSRGRPEQRPVSPRVLVRAIKARKLTKAQTVQILRDYSAGKEWAPDPAASVETLVKEFLNVASNDVAVRLLNQLEQPPGEGQDPFLSGIMEPRKS